MQRELAAARADLLLPAFHLFAASSAVFLHAKTLVYTEKTGCYVVT